MKLSRLDYAVLAFIARKCSRVKGRRWSVRATVRAKRGNGHRSFPEAYIARSLGCHVKSVSRSVCALQRAMVYDPSLGKHRPLLSVGRPYDRNHRSLNVYWMPAVCVSFLSRSARRRSAADVREAERHQSAAALRRIAAGTSAVVGNTGAEMIPFQGIQGLCDTQKPSCTVGGVRGKVPTVKDAALQRRFISKLSDTLNPDGPASAALRAILREPDS